jgi:hypothetical protein
MRNHLDKKIEYSYIDKTLYKSLNHLKTCYNE